MKEHALQIGLGLALALLVAGHAAQYYRIGFISQADGIIYDTRLRLTAPGGIDERIVILDIDEKSLAHPQLGRWPWGRDKMAAIVDKLFDKYGVAELGFDVVNAEPDRSGGIDAFEALARGPLKDSRDFQREFARLRPTLDHDRRFAEAIRGRKVVAGYYFNFDETARESGTLPDPAFVPGTFRGRRVAFHTGRGYATNLPEFQSAAAAVGHFNSLQDFDGITRRVPMLVEYKGAYYESLSLAMVRTLLGVTELRPGFARERFYTGYYPGLEWIEVGNLRVPVDAEACALTPYRGPRGSFRYLSLADVYDEKLPVDALRGKIALIGTSTPTLLDLRATPVGSVYPGVEVHANLIAGMLDGTIKEKPAYMLGADVLLILVLGIALAILVPILPPLRAILASGAALVLVTGLSFWLWVGAGMVLPLAGSLVLIFAIFALNMAYGYFVESRAKRQFTDLFGQYIPPELVDRMAADPARYGTAMEGHSATLTILFSDIRGFTSIAETMEPRVLAQYINDYLTSMSLIIRAHGGTLDKYIGDAIMAFWGAPVDDLEHASHAVAAAQEMRAELANLNARFQGQGLPAIDIGIGINTGPVRVGDMGSRLRRAYTVMGDAVNLASRLEGLTRRYGVGVIVGDETRRVVPGIIFREIDRVRVKGKDEPVAIYEPIGAERRLEKQQAEELKLWNQALRSYRARDWDQAELGLYNLIRLYPGHALYELYAERVRYHRAHPPGPGWDGVTTYDTK